MTGYDLCHYLVCRDLARHWPPEVPVPLCDGHRAIVANAGAVLGLGPHVTPEGALYVGDLDELLARPASP